MQVNSGSLSNVVVDAARITGTMSTTAASIDGGLVKERSVPGLSVRNVLTFVKTFNIDANKLYYIGHVTFNAGG
jgi:hypothetical protein